MNSFKKYIRPSISDTASIISSRQDKMDEEGEGSLAVLLLAEHAR
jgi:hypothetical protein